MTAPNGRSVIHEALLLKRYIAARCPISCKREAARIENTYLPPYIAPKAAMQIGTDGDAFILNGKLKFSSENKYTLKYIRSHLAKITEKQKHSAKAECFMYFLITQRLQRDLREEWRDHRKNIRERCHQPLPQMLQPLLPRERGERG